MPSIQIQDTMLTTGVLLYGHFPLNLFKGNSRVYFQNQFYRFCTRIARENAVSLDNKRAVFAELAYQRVYEKPWYEAHALNFLDFVYTSTMNLKEDQGQYLKLIGKRALDPSTCQVLVIAAFAGQLGRLVEQYYWRFRYERAVVAGESARKGASAGGKINADRCRIYVRRDRIKAPEDLRGRRVGLPEFQLTACVWARIILQDEHGIAPADIVWVRGAIETPGRPEKIGIRLAGGVRLQDAPEGTTISELLERGEIDGFIAPRPPSLTSQSNAQIGWLYADPIAAGRDYFRRTGIFPIMHLTGVRRTLVEKHPWLPAAVFKAFQQAKAKCLKALEDTSATKVTLPFVEEQLRAARELMGDDFWSYGLHPNRKVLETFLRHHHAEGLSCRRMSPEELFHPSTHESFAI